MRHRSTQKIAVSPFSGASAAANDAGDEGRADHRSFGDGHETRGIGSPRDLGGAHDSIITARDTEGAIADMQIGLNQEDVGESRIAALLAQYLT